MTLEELNTKLLILEMEFVKKKKQLGKEYCELNNFYYVGDKFTDHLGTIIIENIKYNLGKRPCCVYYGAELKKDGTPRKDNSKRHAYQSNEKK